MAGHTTGPWEFRKGETNAGSGGGDGVLGAVASRYGWFVCDVWADCVDESDDEPEANARLIAAAPDLLEALESLLGCGRKDNYNPKYDGYYKAAREAIAKARARR